MTMVIILSAFWGLVTTLAVIMGLGASIDTHQGFFKALINDVPLMVLFWFVTTFFWLSYLLLYF
jgi:hypothetical protein